MRVFALRGQSLTELAILLVAVVGIILTMRIYLQRAMQAKYKAGPDYLVSEIKNAAAEKGAAGVSGIKQQYDPYYRESSVAETRSGSSSVGFPETSIEQTSTRSGWEKTRPAQEAD
ncbi:MAG: hypothetical protein PHO03_00220 [Candidatus Omnitrophica bacterium]|nr:hypothetical protein [Candidatus Omnitrophota bacterium]